jgi:hypothetical protein
MNNPLPEDLRDTQPYTPQPTQTFDINPTPPRQFPWGCLLGGCLGTILLGLLVIGLMGYGVYSFAQHQIAKYTADAPVELPTVDISEEEIEAIKTRLEDFRKQFESGEAPQELVITEDEINALIAGNSDLKGRVYIQIEDGNLKADVSIPLDQFPGGKGRYFNGSATLHMELENGVLVANVIDAEANGSPIPEDVMTEFRKQNLAKEMYKDVKTAEALQRCESLVVESDRIVLRVRQKETKSIETPPPPGDPIESDTGTEQSTATPGPNGEPKP